MDVRFCVVFNGFGWDSQHARIVREESKEVGALDFARAAISKGRSRAISSLYSR